MFLKVQKEKSIESDWDAWKSTLRGRVYDLMISNKLKGELITVMWLPFKSTNVDNNNSIFKLLFGKYEPEFGYSISIVEVLCLNTSFPIQLREEQSSTLMRLYVTRRTLSARFLTTDCGTCRSSRFRRA